MPRSAKTPISVDLAIELAENAHNEKLLWPYEATDALFYWSNQDRDLQAKHLADVALEQFDYQVLK